MNGRKENLRFIDQEKLFDCADAAVAPVLIDRKDTAALFDGRSLRAKDELRLIEARALQDSYVRLRCQVIG